MLPKILGIRPASAVNIGGQTENVYIPLIRAQGQSFKFTELKEGILVYAEHKRCTSFIPWANISSIDVETPKPEDKK